MFRFLPPQASTVAPKIDWIHNLITDLSVFFTVAICGAMLYFAIRYRKRNGVDHETPRIHGSSLLEVVWTVVPTLVCIFIAYYGVAIYHEMREVPADALTVNVTGKQWNWDFQYENGKKTHNEFVVPVGKTTKLVLTSSDVLHSFFIPNMRVKRDAVPGQYSYLAFTPVQSGEYQVYCTEYCGDSHSAMLAKLKVLPEAEYDRWYNDRSEEIRRAGMTPAQRGEKLYVESGCQGCHSLDGSPRVGPSWLKIYMRKGKLTDGAEYVADDNYLKESILYPNNKKPEGFANMNMPSFMGQLSDDDITDLISFMKTLKEAPAKPKADDAAKAKMSPVDHGKVLSAEKGCTGCHSIDGSKLVGPTWKGIYGKSGKLADGKEYVANDEYITHSIREPLSQVVEGYPPAMPAIYGPDSLSDADVKDIIEYMKTLK